MLWNKRFAFGLKNIDNQHRHLFELIEETKQLIENAESGVDCYDQIVVILNDLSAYTVEHFTYEEELMKEKGYLDLKEHQLEHQKFIQKVSDFLASDIDKDHLSTINEVVEFLLLWVSDHILYTDAQYVNTLKNKF